MSHFIDRVYDAFDRNPIALIGLVTAVSSAIVKFGLLLIDGQNARTWRREVRRRERRYAR